MNPIKIFLLSLLDATPHTPREHILSDDKGVLEFLLDFSFSLLNFSTLLGSSSSKSAAVSLLFLYILCTIDIRPLPPLSFFAIVHTHITDAMSSLPLSSSLICSSWEEQGAREETRVSEIKMTFNYTSTPLTPPCALRTRCSSRDEMWEMNLKCV